MKRISFVFVFIILFIMLSPILTIAADSPAPVINSDIQRPVPSFYSDGIYDHYTAYYITYKSGRSPEYEMYEVNFHINHGEDVIFALGTYNYSFSSLSNSLTPDSINVYNAINGQILQSVSASLNGPASGTNSTLRGYYYFTANGGLIPNNGQNCTDSFLIADNITVQGNNTKWFSTNEFINWFYPHNNDVIRSTIPQPLSDLRHMYFADHLYLYQLNVDYPVLYNSVGINANNLTSSEFFDQFYISFEKNNSTSVIIKLINRTEYEFNVHMSMYDIVSGEFVSTTTYPILPIQPSGNPSQATIGITVNDPVEYGLWYTGLLNVDGLNFFDKLQISWSDTIDYSQDFVLIRNLLEQIYNKIDNIDSNLNGLYVLLSTNWDWFKTLYYNSILNKWTITNNQLDQIIDALVGTGEETTYPPDENASSEMDNYVSQEDQFFQDFDQAGQEIDNVFNEAVSVFSDNSNGFAFIKMLMETFIFNIPSSYIIVFISLSFGLVVLFLGRAVTKR